MVDDFNINENLDNPATWKKIGNEFFLKKDYEKAIECYTKAVELDPKFLDGWNNLGVSYLKIGKIEEARHCNDKVKQLKNTNVITRTVHNINNLSLKDKITYGILIILAIIAIIVIFSSVLPDAQPSVPSISSPNQKSTPQYGTTIIPTTSFDAKGSEIELEDSPEYKKGDLVQKNSDDSTYDKDRAWVILDVRDDGQYTVGQIYYDPGARKWYRIEEDLPQLRYYNAVERDYPDLIENIDWDSLPVKYLITNEDGNNVLIWKPTPTTLPQDKTSNDCTVEIRYYGDWHGTLMVDNHIRSIQGSGPKKYEHSCYADYVSVSAMKMDDSRHYLSVQIIHRGKWAGYESTDAVYGIASVSKFFY